MPKMLEGCCPTLMSGRLGERPRVYMRLGAGIVCQCSLSPSLAPLALVLTTGGLTLNLPCALLICAVADCTLINLHLSAGWYHRCVGVAIWPCRRNKKNMKSRAKYKTEQNVSTLNFKLALHIFMCLFCVVSTMSHYRGQTLNTESAWLLCSSGFDMLLKHYSVLT